jgi:hypothetical protein
MGHNIDTGLLPKIWGPHMWVALHSITFNYPVNPTEDDKERYKKYFELIGYVLPCSYCAESYRYFITNGETKLIDNVMKNRKSLTEWLYKVHEVINEKLDIDYGVSFEDVETRYESYRAACDHQEGNKLSAKCDMTARRKTISYNIANTKDCPLIPIKIAKHFIKYARTRGLDEKEFYLINNLDVSDNYKKDPALWNKRNIECSEIIDKMKLEGIQSLESSGKWIGFPTLFELQLIMRLSSNLTKHKLIEIIRKLPDCRCEFQKLYKFTI